jgi:hypothetical protein
LLNGEGILVLGFTYSSYMHKIGLKFKFLSFTQFSFNRKVNNPQGIFEYWGEVKNVTVIRN